MSTSKTLRFVSIEWYRIKKIDFIFRIKSNESLLCVHNFLFKRTTAIKHDKKQHFFNRLTNFNGNLFLDEILDNFEKFAYAIHVARIHSTLKIIKINLNQFKLNFDV